MNKQKFLWIAAVMIILSVFSVVANGQQEEGADSWPTKEIKFIYHSKAGSGGDIMCRNLGKALTKELGETIVVENRLGASGYNAWDYTRKADPDGYTFCGVSSTFITSQLINKMDLHPTDYQPVALLFIDPLIIYCRTDAWDGYAEFEKDVRANPGKYKIAGGTPGAIDFMVFKQFEAATGLNITTVPFEGGGEATVAVVGKHLDIGIGEYVDVMPMVEAGKLKVLASFTRMDFGDYPTLADFGYDFEFTQKYRGLLAPKDTPKEIISKLYNAIEAAFDDPEFQNYYETNQLVPFLKGPDEAMDLLLRQYEEVKGDLNVD